MPKRLFARSPVDLGEERQGRKLAGSRHAPGDGMRRAQMVVRRWAGLRTTAIARELGAPPRRCGSVSRAATRRGVTGAASGQGRAGRRG
jgi:hypothetical protein